MSKCFTLITIFFLQLACESWSFTPNLSTAARSQFDSHIRRRQLTQNLHSDRRENDSIRTKLYAGQTDSATVEPTPSFADLLPWNKKPSKSGNTKDTSSSVALTFFNAFNARDFDTLLSLFSEDCEYDDSAFSNKCVGKDEVGRRLRLYCDAYQDRQWIVDDVAVDKEDGSFGVLYHMEDDTTRSGSTRGCMFLQVDSVGLLDKVFVVNEYYSEKSGEKNLKVLSTASKIMESTGYNPAAETAVEAERNNKRSARPPKALQSPAEKYFDAWNRRDMDAAVSVFTDDVKYDDTAFPEAFTGKENLKSHLLLCEDAFPATFSFQVDNIANGNGRLAVLWHVENNEEPLPFTRGCSFYKLDNSKRFIKEGLDIVEPPVLKTGGLGMFFDSLKSKVIDEPIRLIPITIWVAYMYIVFFSDGILPGANALQLEQRTWEEVRDLSLNFFLVSPLLQLPFSPVVHPMLEGVFNLLLSWAAMFAGFLTDDRQKKPNVLPMVPIVVGMQFLTSAFLLPYLGTRTTETEEQVREEDLGVVARVAESPLLGLSMAGVGTGSIIWAFFGRMAEFGPFEDRWVTFLDLLSIDRVGSSFLVDLAIFALFQGWMVDDDLKRRGVDLDDLNGNTKLLTQAAKFVPFFGMAAYLALKPVISAENVVEEN